MFGFFFNFKPRTLSIAFYYYTKTGAGILTLYRTSRQSLARVKTGYRNRTERTDQIFTVYIFINNKRGKVSICNTNTQLQIKIVKNRNKIVSIQFNV